MARIKYTKNELKKQKESLSRFRRYLPTLLLKKQQLQMEIRKIRQRRVKVEADYTTLEMDAAEWIGVFGDQTDIRPLIRTGKIITESGNIAGIDIPLFAGVDIRINEYDLFSAPLWVDKGIGLVTKMLTLQAELAVIKVQLALLAEELWVSSQRVNLFEKVKIPEARENIRVIKIYLGDQQTNAVVRGKISKNKIDRGRS